MSADTNLKLPNRRYALGLGIAWEAHKFFKWAIVAVVVLVVALPLFISQFRSIEISTWAFAVHSGKFFTAIVAATFLYSLFPVFLAQGLTRREFATSMGLFGVVWSLILAAIAMAGFLAEYAWYSLFGWNQAIDQADGLVIDSVGSALAYGAPFPLDYLLYFAAGALIGAATYRWDGGWLIVIPLIPVVLAPDWALTRSEPWGPSDLLQWISGFAGEATVPVAAAATVIVIAVFAWICRAILVETPVRAKKG